MTPVIFERYAAKLWPYRWRLGIATFAAFLSLVPSVLAAQRFAPGATPFVSTLSILAFSWSWGLVCIAVWFHPQHGKMRPGGSRVLRAVPALQSALRWYASFFLMLWFAVPLVMVGAILLD